ncbi:MAG: lipopolysaccharide heptosyltransferase II [Helicobacteraceae bacterium]|jgi:heptosyltransferase-2|nr:lipopolysaccharide heptosyltransferase II [Helicobacteraceae bacterium]
MKFLIVAPNWVGDMVIAQSLFAHLRDRYGADTIIDAIAPIWSLGVLNRMPQIRRAFALDTAHGEFGFRKRKTLGYALRAEKYDRAIVMPTTFKSALVPFFALVPIRSGFTGEARFFLINDRRVLDKKAMPLMVERYLALDERGAAIRNPSLRVDTDNQKRLLNALELDAQKPIIAFFAGAEYGEAKRWLPDYFAELGVMLAKKGFQIWLFGSAKEKDLGDRIAREIGGAARNLCAKTTLEEAIDLIALAKIAITNDSGLMHVAAALNVFIAAIYGSSTPNHTPPLTDKKTIVSLNLPCSPCFKRVCPLGHTNCLTQIAPRAVFESIKDRL